MFPSQTSFNGCNSTVTDPACTIKIVPSVDRRQLTAAGAIRMAAMRSSGSLEVLVMAKRQFGSRLINDPCRPYPIKKSRNARQVIPCSRKKEDLVHENNIPTITPCLEPLPRRQSLPSSRRSESHAGMRGSSLLSPEEGTVNRKEHGETYQLQTERDEMRGREQPAVKKRRKYHHVHTFLTVARTPTPSYTCKAYPTYPRLSNLPSTTSYL